MRFLFFLLFCFLLCVDSSAQSWEKTFGPGQLSVKAFRLDQKKGTMVIKKLPFAAIKVIDARFDTSKLGFIINSAIVKDNLNQFEALKIKNGVAAGIENYYNSYYTTDSSTNGYELLIVLKKFWVTSTLPHGNLKYNYSNIINDESRIIAKWELYIHKENEYLPFRRIDTLIESSQSVKKLFEDESANKYTIYSLLNNFLGQFDYSKAINIFKERQKKSLDEIKDLNNKRFAIPVLTDKSITKGVFINFEEFKNNSPSITTFEEEKIGLTGKFITGANGSRIVNYWAYSDKYTKAGKNGSERFFRTGETFDFFQKIAVVKPKLSYGQATMYGSAIFWVPYQVDMETGNFY